MPINIRVPSFMGGVSRVSQSQRSSIEMESMVNCDVDLSRGTDKRAGTEHITGAGTNESLDLAGVGDDMHVFWIDRDSDADERFVGFIYPTSSTSLNRIQIFNTVTGNEVLIEAKDSTGAEVALNDADADVAAMIAYLANGSQTPQQRFRTISVEDGTFILNRSVVTSLEGTAITYNSASGSPVEVRNQNNTKNVLSWSDFDHPPSTAGTYPTRATLLAGGDITSSRIWYARDDDIGLPQGFYWAVSLTRPPWYTRLPTEPANSYIKRDTMPLLLTFDGTKFVLQLIDWEPRKSGDGTTNPGPTFIGTELDDITFHQGRLWFCSGERAVSSRAGDIFNLWIDSTALVTDADPIDDSVQGTRVSRIRLMESFKESLIMLTDGARQVELRANGPITPQSYQLYNSTDIFSANYVEPTRRGSQLYFAGERDASMLIWEYDYSPQQVSNVAFDLTRRVHGYIPAESPWITASNSHDQLFILSLSDITSVYVNISMYEGSERILNSWFKWEYDVDNIMSCYVFDDFLYFLMERDGLMYLEKQALGDPLQDNDGNQTLGYALRMDRKLSIQGVYDNAANETTFTLPYLNADATYQLVTGPSWDTTLVKAAGTQLTDFTVATAGGVTTLVTDGDIENNADGTDAPCYIGVQYGAAITLSEIFARDENDKVVHGNNHLTRMRVRHRDSGGYSVRVTPDGRSALTQNYVVPNIGSSPLDGDQLSAFGEFQTRVMTHARNSTIELLNDTPFPTAWIDCEFDSTFHKTYSPVR